MPKIRITTTAHVTSSDPAYEATAMQSVDDGGTWTPVLRDDEPERPMELVAGDADRARARMLTALDKKFGADGYELDES